MAEIPTLLGGGDIGATKLWWVRSNRPKQPNQ
ncbi:SusD/RagB family nutrient-binding outer membrane lipoprotein [Bacteroides thetaiotaomicron]|nr:SusD/RagB family nutrient-binding outer membrane lipoprotein [Bacteroides thetaiotaomicron]UVS55746.1 SusD/RagB family nutrient-binding outer membrane lipoprotein [Bacteroides thetaiotaomicron]